VTPGQPTTPTPQPTPEPSQPQEQGVSLFSERGLVALLDTNLGILAMLGLAVLFGAVHALTPGHGKTLVAAYLIGERGTAAHAVWLGLIVTITHTGSVLLVAALLYWLFPGTVPGHVQTILEFVGGLLIAGLGLWLLMKRLAGQADHVHLFGGHHHHHGEGHSHETVPAKPGWGGLLVLGISGGIVPCWDAVVLLGLTIATQRLWLGVPLLLAFSVGLAGVLVALGLIVVKIAKAGRSRFAESRWVQALPIISAVLIMVIGIWLCRDSLRPH
jgi:ABC-type nickel/cobalt efflux system permease component RcnA